VDGRSFSEENSKSSHSHTYRRFAIDDDCAGEVNLDVVDLDGVLCRVSGLAGRRRGAFTVVVFRISGATGLDLDVELQGLAVSLQEREPERAGGEAA